MDLYEYVVIYMSIFSINFDFLKHDLFAHKYDVYHKPNYFRGKIPKLYMGLC